MENVLTEQEAATPVTFGDLSAVLDTVLKAVKQETTQKDLMVMDAVQKSLETLVSEQVKDRLFLCDALSKGFQCTPEEIREYYIAWCAEYNKLKKEKENGDECKADS